MSAGEPQSSEFENAAHMIDGQLNDVRKVPWSKRELVLSAVTILYAAFALAFHLPKVQSTLQPVYTVWNFLGLQQKWNLFAPIIPNTTVHLVGVVTLADGAKVLFAPPHPSNHAFIERFLYNRYLKWEADYAPFPPYKPYLPQLCNHILDEFNFPGEQPKSCALIMELSPISNPKKKISPRDMVPERWWHMPVYRREFYNGGANVSSTP
jgi:hypothetical protein